MLFLAVESAATYLAFDISVKLFISCQHSFNNVMCFFFSFFNLIVKDENKRSDTQEFFNKLKDIFPRISEPLQPRSLLHLCRCQVRGSLAQSRSLPHGVWKLNIPLTLKNYIMLQKNQNDYRGNFDLASKKRSVGDSLVSCKRVRRN